MKLDTRIMDGKKPLNCFDTEEAESYVGKECYFSNDLFTFADMSDITNRKLIYKGTLLKVWFDESDSYETDLNSFYAYCLPCEWVTEEKKYRPFTLKEFLLKYKIGSAITIRMKNDDSVNWKLIIMGHRIETLKDGTYYKTVYIGNSSYTLYELFDSYEVRDSDTDTFIPFGVEE